MAISVMMIPLRSFLSVTAVMTNWDQVKKMFPVTKNGFIIPVYKFYKQVLYLDRDTGEYDLQYIAMIKKNKED